MTVDEPTVNDSAVRRIKVGQLSWSVKTSTSDDGVMARNGRVIDDDVIIRSTTNGSDSLIGKLSAKLKLHCAAKPSFEV